MTHDPRLRDLLGTALGQEAPRAVLIGFPADGPGRPGAAAGPDALRRCLHECTPDAQHPEMFADLARHTEDRGNLDLSGDPEADQRRLGDAVADILAIGAFPIVLGGGRDTAYGHFLGHAGSGSAVDLLSWDAHLPGGPGPVQALDHPSGLAGRMQVAGLQTHTATASGLRRIRERGGRVFWVHDLTRSTVVALFDDLRRSAMVSFSVEAVDQAWAPGVGAPSTGGLAPDLWLLAARTAGRNAAILSADVAGLNPAFDRDAQTARLAALTVWHLLAGLAARIADR